MFLCTYRMVFSALTMRKIKNDLVDKHRIMKKRITIDVDGRPRTVVSIKELPTTYDLNIHITGSGRSFQADTFRELVAGTNETNFQRSDMHISVHNNPKSDDTNTIKKTIEFDDGNEKTDV